jgi:hypothetical protein
MTPPDTMRCFSLQSKMRSIGVAALVLLSIGAVHTARQTLPAGCPFNVPLTAAQCQRLLQSHRQTPARSWSSSRTNQTLIYASQPFSSVVTISALTAKGGLKLVGELTMPSGGFPLGLTVDSSQNLYVAISPVGSGVASVAVYPRGATMPSEVYTSGLSGPVDVAVDRYGTLYVANLANPGGGGCGQGSGPGGSVVEYVKGSTTPSRTITDFPGCPNALGVDSNADLYMTYVYYPASGFAQSDVREYQYQSIHGVPLHLHVRGGALFGGIAVTSAGDIVVENVQDDATLNQVLTFAQNSKKLIGTIQYGGDGWGTGFKFFALLGQRLFAPAYVVESFSYVVTTVGEFEYPSGREIFVQNPALVSLPFAYGVAVSTGKTSR